ncbi:unnamed protein product [Blepharisma stoltei]|uniref:Protein kinase domain-containing protein n=1 Tax=Blepharisma stoltei TaxID=1481888 RepID=A0AAU9IH97_9CILI|nr:unnamed protein product [Blepharisma stoltei]
MALFPEELTNVFQVKDHFNGEAYGTIYRAIKRSNGKMHAIKAVARTSTGLSWKDIAAEVQILLYANPYKLRLDSFFVSDNTFFIVIDYCGNGDFLKAIFDKFEGHELRRNLKIFFPDLLWAWVFALQRIYSSRASSTKYPFRRK